MWAPKFSYERKEVAVLRGFRRDFCIHSLVHRGTADKPGLVLGLRSGGSVEGMAFRVKDSDWKHVKELLREREKPGQASWEEWVDVDLYWGGRVNALVFVTDERLPQWAGDMSLEQKCRIISSAIGRSGDNFTYLRDTVSFLEDHSLIDPSISSLWKRCRQSRFCDSWHAVTQEAFDL